MSSAQQEYSLFFHGDVACINLIFLHTWYHVPYALSIGVPCRALVSLCYAIMEINFRDVKIFHRVDAYGLWKQDMKFKIWVCFLCSLICLSFLPDSAQCVEIKKLDISVEENIIHVSTSLSLDEKHLSELKSGIEKEIRFYIDLFKMWNVWPDEFILGKFSIRTVKYDPVKTEYIATSNDGRKLIEKRFTSFESMVKWALSIHELKFVIPKDLEPGAYFIRLIVVSKVRKLPPVLRDLLIFIPENEFKITKDSPVFHIGPVE